MQILLILRHEDLAPFREACEFHEVEIISESVPETFAAKPYPGKEVIVEADPASMFYVGKAMERIRITGEL